jgi:hypothetical protein
MVISDGQLKGHAAMTSALALQYAQGKIGNNMLVKLKHYVVNSIGSMKCASPHANNHAVSPRLPHGSRDTHARSNRKEGRMRELGWCGAQVPLPPHPLRGAQVVHCDGRRGRQFRGDGDYR